MRRGNPDPLKKLRHYFETNYTSEPVAQQLQKKESETSFPTASIFSSVYKVKDLNRCNEIDIYINTAQESEEVDPVAWWYQRKTCFPNLNNMALDILSVPATSVPSEESFSKAGNLITKKRNRLSQSTIQASMCLQSWLYFLRSK